MFNRKLSTLVVVACFSLLPVVAQASTSRLEGMSLPGDYTMDYTAIYSWPASITGLGNLVYGELGDDNGSGQPSDMGAVLPNLWDGKYGVWSLHLRQLTPALGQGDQGNVNPGDFGFDPNTNANQSFDIGWGKKSGKTALGVTLTRSFNSFQDEVPGTTLLQEHDNAFATLGFGANLRRNIFGIGVGASTEWSENATLEASILWQARTYEESVSGAGAAKREDDGGANYLLALRAMHKCSPTVTMVPVFKYYAFDLSNKGSGAVGADLGSWENTMKGWQAGVAGNWAIGSNDLFVLGGTFAQNKVDQQSDVFGLAGATGLNDTLTTTETLAPMLFMALETQVNSWLTIRFGANKTAWHTTKIEGYTGAGATHTAETLTIKDSPFAMSTGACVKLGSLKFDAVLADGFFNNPFGDLMAGENSNTSAPFTKVSATYNW